MTAQIHLSYCCDDFQTSVLLNDTVSTRIVLVMTVSVLRPSHSLQASAFCTGHEDGALLAWSDESPDRKEDGEDSDEVRLDLDEN